MSYFTDRVRGPVARNIEEVTEPVWEAIYALIWTGLSDRSFGFRFPESCPDNQRPVGVDRQAFGRLLAAEVPGTEWPLNVNNMPETPVIMDILEFCASTVADPIEGGYHDFFSHYHLSWDRSSGLTRFVSQVNTLFARNGLAYEMSTEGQVCRLLPSPLANALSTTVFQTGDAATNQLLEVARLKIVSATPADRMDALEKLWDAFERIKTLPPGTNKKVQADQLLDSVASPGTRFRDVLGAEAKALTEIGNQFRIRHHETDREPIISSAQCDYFFGRAFDFVRLILKVTGQGG